MDDEMIKLLAEKGGVIQITFGSMFVNEQINKAYKDRKKNVLDYIEANNLQGEARDEYFEKYAKDNPLGDADISDVVANIDVTNVDLVADAWPIDS